MGTSPCRLREALGDDVMDAVQVSMTRRLADAYNGTEAPRPVDCAAAHDVAELLLEQGHLVTSTYARRLANGAVTLARGEAEHWRNRVDEVRREVADDLRALARVRALIDVRRKTLRMDDLRAALNDAEEGDRG